MSMSLSEYKSSSDQYRLGSMFQALAVEEDTSVATSKKTTESTDFQRLLRDTHDLIEVTECDDLDIDTMRQRLAKAQFDSVLVIDKLVNWQDTTSCDDSEHLEVSVEDKLEYLSPKKFKARGCPEFVLYEQWELEERKLKEKAKLLRDRKAKVSAENKGEKGADSDENRQQKRRPKRKKPARPRMVQMCADAMDPWERMAWREKRRRQRLINKKYGLKTGHKQKRTRPPVQSLKPPTLLDDLQKQNGTKEPTPAPKEFVSAVEKVMAKTNKAWAPKLETLFRGSVESEMSHNQFIDCLMELQVELTANEILACYNHLDLDHHGHIIKDQPMLRVDKHNHEKRVSLQRRINKSKSQRSVFAKHYSHAERDVKVRNYRSKMNKVNIFRVKELEGRIDMLEGAGKIYQNFRKAMEKAREAFRYSPRFGNDIKSFLNKFDYDNDGTIGQHEFVSAMESINAGLSDEEARACFAFLDPEGLGEIDYHDFVYIYYNRRSITHKALAHNGNRNTHYPISPEGNRKGTHAHRAELKEGLSVRRDQLMAVYMDTTEEDSTLAKFHLCMKHIQDEVKKNGDDIANVFRSLDTDNDGSITREEFLTGLEQVGTKLSDEDLHTVFDTLDPSGDNQISLVEFEFMYFNRRRAEEHF